MVYKISLNKIHKISLYGILNKIIRFVNVKQDLFYK